MDDKQNNYNGHKIISHYLLKKKIGRGSFSQVFQAYDMKNQKYVAIKVISSQTVAKNPSIKTGLTHEISSLNLTKECPYIINLINYLKTKNNYYLVYQLCSDGTLEDLIKKQGFLSQDMAVQLFKQILEGFKILNKCNIIHRDVKPNNILLQNGSIKIADFGLCKKLPNKCDLMQSIVGTLNYQAPQILIGDTYTEKCDIYSLGVLLYKMLFGFCPFIADSTIEMIYQFEQKKLNISHDKQISLSIKHILKRMIQKDEQRRADWEQVFQFFRKYSDNMNDNMGRKSEENLNEIQNSHLLQIKNQKKVSQSETQTSQSLLYEQFAQNKQNDDEMTEIQKIIQLHENVMNMVEKILKIRQNPESIIDQTFLQQCLNKVEMVLKQIQNLCIRNQDIEEIQEMIVQNIQLLQSIILEIGKKSQKDITRSSFIHINGRFNIESQMKNDGSYQKHILN